MNVMGDYSSDEWRKDWIEWNLRKTKVWGEKTLVRKKYSLSEGHTHCEFCWGEFGVDDGGFLIGYNIKDTSVWICDECFNTFKNYFLWKVDDEK